MKAYGSLCTEFYNVDKKFATEEELAIYVELFQPGELLLEPMCGSGRLLIPLLQKGIHVHGFDISLDMLSSCKKRASEFGLEPMLQQVDLQHFKSDTTYDGIIIPLGSFQIIYPRLSAYEALRVFHDLLKPGGKLVMDLFIPWDVLYENAEKESSSRNVELSSGETIQIDNESFANKFEQHILSKTRYTKFNDKIKLTEENEEMDILWYYQYEMMLMLERYQFKNIQIRNRFLNGHDHYTYIAETPR